MITFVIVGHNEADTIGTVVNAACAAAGPGDVVLAVDSASTDATASAARKAGAVVLEGPLGKGAAMNTGVVAATTPWVCFLDADLTYSDRNIAAVLAAAVHRDAAHHIVGDFADGLRAVLTNTEYFYRPLVAALFPEIANTFGSKPLTGFRAIRREYLREPLPPDFGVEAYLNVTVTLGGGGPPAVVDLGRFDGKMKTNVARTLEITRTVFDLAIRWGRLSPARRPDWEGWVQQVYTISSTWRPDDDKVRFARLLREAADRPLPSPR